MPVPMPGEVASDFELLDAEGEVFTLSRALERGPVALFFVKAGCATTALAAPFVTRLVEGYGGHLSAEGTELTVVAVSQEGAEASKGLRTELGLGCPMLVDEALRVSRLYDLESTPTLLLLRGRERLRVDSERVPSEDAYRVADLVEGWSLDAYVLFSEEIAARVGALPVNLYDGVADVPSHRPG